MSRIALALRVARARRGWSREALAYHSGISWAAIAQIEAGRRSDVRLSSLTALADALGVSIDYLCRGGAGGVGLLDHRALVYRSDEEFLAALTPVLADPAGTGSPVLVVTRPNRGALVRAALAESGRTVEVMDWSAWYDSPLATLARYTAFVRQSVEDGAPWVGVIGEPQWAGLSGAEVAAWIRYESLINLVLAPWPVTLVCPYDARSLPPEILTSAERTHPQLCHAGGHSSDSARYEPPEHLLLASTTDEP